MLQIFMPRLIEISLAEGRKANPNLQAAVCGDTKLEAPEFPNFCNKERIDLITSTVGNVLYGRSIIMSSYLNNMGENLTMNCYKKSA